MAMVGSMLFDFSKVIEMLNKKAEENENKEEEEEKEEE